MPSPSRTCRKHLREHCTEHCTAAEKPDGRIGLGRKIERFYGELSQKLAKKYIFTAVRTKFQFILSKMDDAESSTGREKVV